MEHDPNNPWVTPVEEFLDAESQSISLWGYASKLDKLAVRRSALILIEQLQEQETDALVPYLAITCFDGFFARQELQARDFKLAVACCFSLASKKRNHPFSVHQFLTAKQNLNIAPELIMKMESRILITLDAKIHSKTALWFVGYFLRRLPEDLRPSRQTVYRIIIESVRDIKYTLYKPSVIAASAILIASSALFPARYEECFDSIWTCEHVNVRELDHCIDMIRLTCEKQHILEGTHQAGEAPSSNMSSGSAPESSETMDIIRRRPGKEPKQEGLESNPEVEEWVNLIEEIERWPGSQPMQAILEIMEEPENMKKFPLKWVSDVDNGISLTVARSYLLLGPRGNSFEGLLQERKIIKGFVSQLYHDAKIMKNNMRQEAVQVKKQKLAPNDETDRHGSDSDTDDASH